ncbi:MAG: hypothetical protein GY726_16580 [Proteobacteria bacterium]|nr:hypothetical protein [Pseudomonadota bacterium]
MRKMISTLTDRQRYWLEHVQACEASGKSMAEYAASQGIAVRAMYGGKKTLVKKGVLPVVQPTRFQRVQVMEATASSQWRIGLPNGVSVAFAGEVDSRALTTVLNVSASLE